MRTPSLNISSRIPSDQSDGGAAHQSEHRRQGRDDGRPNAAGSARPLCSAASRIGCDDRFPMCAIRPISIRPADYAYRGSDGECRDQTGRCVDGGGIGPSRQKGQRAARAATPRRRRRSTCAPIARRNRGRDRRLAVRRAGRRAGAASRPGAAANRRIFRWSAPPSACSASPIAVRWRPCAANLPPMPTFARCSRISVTCCRTRRRLLTEGDPAQYALAKLRLPQAHTLAHGINVTRRRDRFRHRRSSIPNSRIRSRTVSMRSAARKARMSTAPASPARSWRMRG